MWSQRRVRAVCSVLGKMSSKHLTFFLGLSSCLTLSSRGHEICINNQNIEPRLFRLYDELEKGEKGIGDQSLSYGLANPKDTEFREWNATIVGPQNTKFDGRIYFLTIKTGDNYPKQAPEVSFQSKINIPSVNQNNGLVEPSKFSLFKNWTWKTCIENILLELKKEMIANKNLNQPKDGDMY